MLLPNAARILGLAMEKLNNRDAAHAFYTRALELDSNLAEAPFSH